jgi:hypothetical protein
MYEAAETSTTHSSADDSSQIGDGSDLFAPG